MGRDPAEIERSVNVGFYMSADRTAAAEKRARESTFQAAMAGGSLVGTPAEAVDRIGEYERAGAEVLPVFHAD